LRAGDSAHATIGVTDATGVSAARRRAAQLTHAAGFNEVAAGRAAIVVTEAATNLLKHGAGGEMLLRALRSSDGAHGVEILALDRGKGIASLSQALQDGYSTAGSPGTGLGALSRQADLCEIYSLPGKGTAILAQIWGGPPQSAAPVDVAVGAAGAACPGEDVSGDGWLAIRRGRRATILMVDGLGHGQPAAEARSAALRIFAESRAEGPAPLVEALHAGLRATRGAAVTVTEIDPDRHVLRFCGLGNISAVIIAGGQARHLVSHNGTAGHSARKIDEFTYPWRADALLVQHTDGLTGHWNLEAYPGLAARHPSLVAGVLYRDFKRGRDDVAVVVARQVAA
jgi:anti-sigma regulatory factor (Ser/Thr protein kinase)